jgi:hypothetical protein
MIAASTGKSADEAERNTTTDPNLQVMEIVYYFCCSESTLCHRFSGGTRRLAEMAAYLFNEAAE